MLAIQEHERSATRISTSGHIHEHSRLSYVIRFSRGRCILRHVKGGGRQKTKKVQIQIAKHTHIFYIHKVTRATNHEAVDKKRLNKY